MEASRKKEIIEAALSYLSGNIPEADEAFRDADVSDLWFVQARYIAPVLEQEILSLLKEVKGVQRLMAKNCQQEIDNYKEVIVQIGDARITWEYVGEGNCGDYNPDDPDDQPLLRFSCYKRHPGYVEEPSDEWDEVTDGSYCTQLPVNTPVRHLLLAAVSIYDAINSSGTKRRLEELSWLQSSDFESIERGETKVIDETLKSPEEFPSD